MNIPSTVARTPLHTAEHLNREIRHRTEKSVARCAAAGRDSIDDRLDELDEEWDVDRTLEAVAESTFLQTLMLGAICRLVLAFDHGTHCHPIAFSCNPGFRHFGFRTASEIDYERYALKSVRGDFDVIVVQGPANAEQLIETMRR